MEGTLKGALTRALISKGARRVADIEEALSIARELAGPSNRSGLDARNKLIDSLRGMLNDEGIRNSPLAVAKLARHLRELRETK
jgi:hypothetical protein